VHHPVSSDEDPYVVVECRLRGARGNQSKIGISGEKEDTGRRLWT